MSDTSPPQAAPAATTTTTAAPAAAKEPPSVIIRPWPKVVFMYPIFICATVFWMMAWLGGQAEGSTTPTRFNWMGNAFLLVIFLNLLVFAFDFSRIKSLTILFAVIALVMAMFYFELTGPLKDWSSKVDIQMNTWFYGTFSVMMGLILLLVLLNTRFNYYEVNHREILHHHGYLGDVTRMPTTGLRLNKEIYDLMEFVLLRSGRLVFYPSTSREAIVIDNVLNVNHVEDRIKDLLSVVAVRMADGAQYRD